MLQLKDTKKNRKKMKKALFLILFMTALAYGKTYTHIRFSGSGTDMLVGELSKDALLKVIGKPYPPFYAFWRKDPVFKESELEGYLERLRRYYRSLGYYKATFTPRLHPDTIEIEIQKGPVIKVASLKTDANATIRTLIPFRIGSPFRTDLFKESKKRIVHYLQTHAHPKYALDAKAYVDPARYRVDLEYRIDPGPFCRFGDTNITGGADVRQRILNAQIVYKKGDPYDVRKIEQSYDNFYDLQAYDYILAEPDLESNSTDIPVKIALKMGETRFLHAHAGYGTNDGVHGGISWKDIDFFGNLKQFETGIELSSSLGYGYFARFYNPWLQLPWIGKSTFEERFSLAKRIYDSYDERTVVNRITLGKKLYALEHHFGLLTEISHVDAKTLDASIDSGNYFLNALFYRAMIDRRDSITDATRGYFLSLYLERSMPLLGSDLDYLKALLEAHYIRRFGKFILGLKSRIGMIDERVPLFKRFYTGGSFTNRGYAYRDLGPKDAKGVPLGGSSLVDLLAEVRYPIGAKLSVVGFYDTSMLSLRPHSFDHPFYGSWGFGMRYHTPIGPFRIDFGFPVRDRGWEFHLNIGQVF